MCTERENTTKTEGKNMSKTLQKKLERIAMDASYAIEVRGGLDTRNNDSEDFIETSVSAILTMLEKAYELGKQAK